MDKSRPYKTPEELRRSFPRWSFDDKVDFFIHLDIIPKDEEVKEYSVAGTLVRKLYESLYVIIRALYWNQYNAMINEIHDQFETKTNMLDWAEQFIDMYNKTWSDKGDV